MSELERVASALRRWWWVVAAAAVVGAIGGAVSAAATGGPSWVATATIRVDAGAINEARLQAAVDDVVRARNGTEDVSAAIARHAKDDPRRTVRITVAADRAATVSAALDACVQRFRDSLAAPVSAVDIGRPTAPESTAVVALLVALAFAACTAAAIALSAQRS